jgi:predicted nucleic acid-binding protein
MQAHVTLHGRADVIITEDADLPSLDRWRSVAIRLPANSLKVQES